MKVLVAVNEFKGSLSSLEIGEIISNKLNSNYDNITALVQPIADGGDGFLALFKGFEKMKFKTINAARQECEVNYLLDIKRKEAVIEIAEVIGLKHLKDIQKDPYKTSTVGLGRLISFLLKKGINHFIIGLGGSATNDCGIGMLSELGVQFTDKNGNICKHGIDDLMKINQIDLRFIDEKFKNAKFTIISDVNNPLTGKNGSAHIFGPQKGATPEMVEVLDKNLLHYSEVVKKDLKIEINDVPGAGAAGGLGAGLLTLGAILMKGVEIVIDTVDLEKKLKDADLVITGEGGMDRQTIFGKTPFGVAQVAKKYNIPVIGIAGNLGSGYEILYDNGFDAIFSIMPGVRTLEVALASGSVNVENTVRNIFRALKSIKLK